MPATLRATTATGIAVAALFALSGCFAIPNLTPDATPSLRASDGSGAELIDTTWQGTDSDGDQWVYTFQEDHTVAVTYNGDSYDDPDDVWTVSGTAISISVYGGDTFGDVIHTGEYTGLDNPMELNVRTTVGDFTWTISLERR
jgi:hypothetical protein